ncbi:hypothetical protein [Frankia sp. Cr2]|uniref:hypothetical protein n=1 Tax=Frankia sp. Cr2 TaxID=3073932 RepID=UPI002AD4B472|nr:hypothetical protein [Frankia sp. Cr2]
MSPGHAAFTAVHDPITTSGGQRIPGLRFTDPRVHALLCALLVFRLLPHGFTNRDLRDILAPLLGRQPATMTSGQMIYDLRRLRLHGLIERIPHTHRYQVTRQRPASRTVLHPCLQPAPAYRHG